MKTTLTRALLASALALPLVATAGDFSPYVDAKGSISRPTNFRTHFVHLGSWAVLDEKSAARGLHDVYTEKTSAEAYRKTGKFPDGATLVKEIRKLETGAMTTGDPVVWGSDAAVWFVMVKNAKGRFASNPQWGDGWGWAMFKADAPATNVAASYDADCKACHIPAAQTDRVFIQGYPTLSPH
ncbi:MAG: cytochrome C [Denitromonas halophila]|nr:MAG: cytochrome C [Denitromonas halophila]TVT74736.1 MAG: cytochrome C [Denitromonas halophila]